MKNDKIKNLFNDFYEGYNETQKSKVWENQKNQFCTFWKEKVMNGEELYDSEIDEIVRLLDTHGKGNTPESESIARVMVPQGAWRRMFNHFIEFENLRAHLNKSMFSKDDEEKINAIDSLYKFNKGNKNNLTGQTASAINAFLALSDPFKNLSVVSLNDRYKIMDFFSIKPGEYQDLSIGEKVVKSNAIIRKYFEELNITSNARTASVFLYKSTLKNSWRNSNKTSEVNEREDISSGEVDASYSDAELSFYMESHLEDFLIENWDNTELANDYELVEEDGELVSQQYHTDIGIIDILAKEKQTEKYVVIELKKGQSSDRTIGQISRYMGWIDEHKATKPDTKGIIISGKYDEKLYYASRRIKDVELYIYKVDFELDEFKK